MATSGKHIVGYGGGFWGTEHFPVKFTYSEGFGFIMQPHTPEGMAQWVTPEDPVQSTAKGWVPPFSYPNGTLINGGVGTPGTTWPYSNLLRVTPKDNGVGISRGLKYTTTPAFNTIEWMSSDFSRCISWKGPSNRYGPDEEGTALVHPGQPYLQGQTVRVAFTGSGGPTVRSVDYSGASHDVSGHIAFPLIANRTAYTDSFYYVSTTDLWDYVDGAVLPSDWSRLYSEEVYLNGKLLVKAPVDNNRPAGSEVCGQPGYVQGACLRDAPPDTQYYNDVEETLPTGREDWITVVTHEWWIEDATLCRILYVADRVYTIPLKYAEGKNPGVASAGVLASLASQIATTSGATKQQLIEDYKKEYRKWHLVETFLTPIDNTLPATFDGYKPWLFWQDGYKSQGEHYSFNPWLFSQSGRKALQSRAYRDPASTEYERRGQLLREITLTDAAIPTATWEYPFGPDLTSALAEFSCPYSGGEERIGKLFIAADYKGETLVTAYAEGSHSSGVSDYTDLSLVTPWIPDNTLPAMYTQFDGNQQVMVLSALDLRYDFVCYGMYEVTNPSDFYVAYSDWIVDSTGIPLQLGTTYSSSLQSSYRSENIDDAWAWMFSGSSGDCPSYFPWQANGTCLRFTKANTYVLTHQENKRCGPLVEGDFEGWLTPREREDGYDFQGWVFGVDVPGNRTYLSRAVINGGTATTLPALTGSYTPYTGNTMFYSAITLG